MEEGFQKSRRTGTRGKVWRPASRPVAGADLERDGAVNIRGVSGFSKGH